MISSIGRSIWTRASQLEIDAGCLGQNICNAFAGRSWRDLSRLFDQPDKISKFSLSTLRFIPVFISVAARVSGFVSDSTGIKKGIQIALTPVLQTTAFFKEFAYSLLWIKDIPHWMEEKDVNGKLQMIFKCPTWDTVFYTMGDIGEALGFVHQFVYKFEIFTRASEAIGEWKLLPINDIPVISTVPKNPKDLFIFIACSIRLVWYIKEYGYLTLIKTGPDTADEAARRKDLLQLETIIKNVVCSIGKTSLIWAASVDLCDREWFPFLSLLSDLGSLMGGVLNERKEVIRASIT